MPSLPRGELAPTESGHWRAPLGTPDVGLERQAPQRLDPRLQAWANHWESRQAQAPQHRVAANAVK